jgi:predicted metalloprotease with PDZ domain
MHEHIDNINPRADLAGIERGGYRLIYTDKPNASEKTVYASLPASYHVGINVWYSLGIRVGSDGTISDVRWNGPVDKANIGPGAKILAVNGNIFSADALKRAIKDAKGNTNAIHLILQNDTFVSLADIDYHDGERYPVLERIPNTPAYLDDITTPLTTPEKAPAEKKQD